MIWLDIVVVAGVLIIVIGVLARWRPLGDVDAADVDPLFAPGIAVTGAGVALGTAVDPALFAVMVAGLITMAVAVYRRRHRSSG